MASFRKCIFVLAMAAVLLAGGASVAMGTPYVFSLQKTLDFPGAGGTEVCGINDNGKVVGTYWVSGKRHGFMYDISSDKYTSFDVPVYQSDTYSFGINNQNQIVGKITVPGESHCFLYDGLGFTVFDVPGAYLDSQIHRATGINEAKHMVGSYTDSDLYEFGFLYTSGFQQLSVLGSSETHAWDINNHDHIVGGYLQDGKTHGFFFDGLSYQTLDYPTGEHTIVFGLNDADTMVGKYNVLNASGFLYDQETFSAISIPDSTIVLPYDINNLNQIVGTYVDIHGNHGFVGQALPIILPPLHSPVPPSLLLLATGLLGLAGLGYRRRGG